jgi:hypothetical protein
MKRRVPVDIIKRKEFADSLNRDWAHFVQRCTRQSPAAQQVYLSKQGYACLSDLLAHILAWWMDGQQVVEQMRGNPSLPLPNYDVDQFNARAVEKFGDVDVETMLQMFEAQRCAMLDLVSRLDERELEQANINTRLYYEIIMHWKEHA